jgi:hypothetical protein
MDCPSEVVGCAKEGILVVLVMYWQETKQH